MYDGIIMGLKTAWHKANFHMAYITLIVLKDYDIEITHEQK